MSETVRLDVYSGPLDLLLHLVKKAEIDVFQISTTAIVDQFLEQVKALAETTADLEQAANFLVLTAALMEFKSEMLLPRPDQGGEPDLDEFGQPRPSAQRLNLLKLLIEFKRYRDRAEVLTLKFADQARRFSRPALPLPQPDFHGVFLDEVSIGDLFATFQRLITNAPAPMQPVQLPEDERDIDEWLAELKSKLSPSRWTPLLAVLSPSWGRYELISLFWTVLELVKRQEGWVEQRQGDLRLKLRQPGEATPVDIAPLAENQVHELDDTTDADSDTDDAAAELEDTTDEDAGDACQDQQTAVEERDGQ